MREKEGEEQEKEEEEIERRQRGRPGGKVAPAARIFLFEIIQNENDKKSQKKRKANLINRGERKFGETLYSSIFFLQF